MTFRARMSSSERLVIQVNRERKRNVGAADIAMVADVIYSGHEGTTARGERVLSERTTVYRVIPREVRVRIAECVGNCPWSNVRCQVSTEGNIQREGRSASAHADIGHGSASIAAQLQAACGD